MISIQETLQLFPIQVSKARSERALLIEDFVKGLGNKYKPAYIAIRLSHLKKDDLYWFYKKCYSSDNFARCFFGCLKIK